KLRHRINAIIHPAVAEDMERFVEEHASHQLIIKESALLFEAGLAGKMNKIVLVTAPPELRIRRVQARDGISEREVRARISSQWPDEEKAAKSDFVIVNDEVQAVIPQVLAIYKELLHV
ncbi:MAG: dephospho-CoA kinase, partial [Bacteroidia bacterium]